MSSINLKAKSDSLLSKALLVRDRMNNFNFQLEKYLFMVNTTDVSFVATVDPNNPLHYTFDINYPFASDLKQYDWKFGAGYTGSSSKNSTTAEFTYPAEGDFVVTMIANDSIRGKAIYKKRIRVGAPLVNPDNAPDSNITLTRNPNDPAGRYTITVNYDNPGPNVNYAYNMGDGSPVFGYTNSPIFYYDYKLRGSFVITVYVSDPAYNTGDQAAFIYTKSVTIGNVTNTPARRPVTLSLANNSVSSISRYDTDLMLVIYRVQYADFQSGILREYFTIDNTPGYEALTTGKNYQFKIAPLDEGTRNRSAGIRITGNIYDTNGTTILPYADTERDAGQDNREATFYIGKTLGPVMFAVEINEPANPDGGLTGGTLKFVVNEVSVPAERTFEPFIIEIAY